MSVESLPYPGPARLEVTKTWGQSFRWSKSHVPTPELGTPHNQRHSAHTLLEPLDPSRRKCRRKGCAVVRGPRWLWCCHGYGMMLQWYIVDGVWVRYMPEANTVVTSVRGRGRWMDLSVSRGHDDLLGDVTRGLRRRHGSSSRRYGHQTSTAQSGF